MLLQSSDEDYYDDDDSNNNNSPIKITMKKNFIYCRKKRKIHKKAVSSQNAT